MILETIPLPGADRRRSEPAPPVSQADYRRGSVSSSPVAKSAYARVGAEAADKNKDQAAETAAKPAKNFSLWENSAFGFGDFLDIINPLQHIPIVATLYRNMTGDQIGLAPRVIGGALWGRIGGLVAGLVNAAVEWFTGKDIGDHIYVALRGGGANSPSSAAIGRAGTPPASADQGAAGAGRGTDGQHSSALTPALEKPSDDRSWTDVTETKPFSSSSTAVPPAYILAAHPAISRDDADDARNGSAAARRQLRCTA